MSIEYKVSIGIPDDLFSLYGNDDEFNAVLSDAIEGGYGCEVNELMYNVMFDDISNAQLCESKLIQLFNEYDSKRDEIVNRINHIQECISSIIVDTEGKMESILSQRELAINESLSKFLSYESDTWLKLRNN